MAESEQNGAMTTATAFDRNPQLVIPRRFKRNAPQVLAMAPSADTGLWLLQYMAERIGIPDLAGLDILDFGCGSRFAEAITTHDIPLRSYVGIDVYKEMIEFLTQNVNDDRLSFHHLNARNPKYNKSGDPLVPDTILPIGDKRFDVICMFSVITHQLPHDAQAIFAILRRHVKESGFLFFSACLGEGDFGYREHDPEKPTELSVYSKGLLIELLEREKWRVVSIEPESPRDLPILDSILCAPASVPVAALVRPPTSSSARSAQQTRKGTKVRGDDKGGAGHQFVLFVSSWWSGKAEDVEARHKAGHGDLRLAECATRSYASVAMLR